MFGEQNPTFFVSSFFSDIYRRSVRDWETAARIMFLKARHDYLTGGSDPMLRRSWMRSSAGSRLRKRGGPIRKWWRIGDSRKEVYSQEKGWQTSSSVSWPMRNGPKYGRRLWAGTLSTTTKNATSRPIGRLTPHSSQLTVTPAPAAVVTLIWEASCVGRTSLRLRDLTLSLT